MNDRAAVDRDRRALIDAGHHPLRVGGIDPEEARVRAARRAPERRDVLARVGRAIDRRAHEVHDVGMLRIGVDLPAGARELPRAERPRVAAVIGAIEPAHCRRRPHRVRHRRRARTAACRACLTTTANAAMRAPSGRPLPPTGCQVAPPSSGFPDPAYLCRPTATRTRFADRRSRSRRRRRRTIRPPAARASTCGRRRSMR